MSSNKPKRIKWKVDREWEEATTLLFIKEGAEKDSVIRFKLTMQIDHTLLARGIDRKIFKNLILNETYTRMVKDGKIIPEPPPAGNWNKKFYILARQDSDIQHIHPYADKWIDELLSDISLKCRHELPLISWKKGKKQKS